MHTSHSLVAKIKTYILTHKIVSIVVAVIVLGGGYWVVSPSSAAVQTRYVLSKVRKGTIAVTVSGTGQVGSSNQIDVAPKTSGTITYIGAKVGDKVSAGDILVRLDARDALKALRDAEASEQSAEIDLERSKLQSTGDVTTANQSTSKAGNDLTKAYDTGFNEVVSTFQDFPSVILDTHDILYNWKHSSYMFDDTIRTISGDAGLQMKLAAGRKYDASRVNYDTLFAFYKTLARTSDQASIDSLIQQTYEETRELSDMLKQLQGVISYYRDRTTATQDLNSITSDQNLLNGYITKVNTHLANLLTAKGTIDDAKNGIVNSHTTVSEKTASLNGADTLDIQSAELSLTQKQNALIDAQNKLADDTIRAPFDGVIGKMDVTLAGTVSPSTSVATIVTKDKIATISLNEVDVAHVEAGQHATLTFDALPDAKISGTVISVDSVGSISQGVVSYNVKISLDTPDDRIKSSMSVSASIVTNSKSDVLMVPVGAIKSRGSRSSLQTIPGATFTKYDPAGITSTVVPTNIPVEVGLTNDTDAEITSGVAEGDIIIARIITGTAATTAATQSRSGLSLLGGGGGTRGAGGGGAQGGGGVGAARAGTTGR